MSSPTRPRVCPRRATLNPATGLLSWTPQPGQAGSYNLIVTASDGSLSGSEGVAIAVTPSVFPPVFVPLLPQYAREGTPITFTVVAADLDGDPLTYTLANTPSGATLNATSGRFTWTPAFGSAGDQTLHFSATNPGGKSATMDVVVHVAHVIRPPIVDTPNHQATLGLPLNFAVVATDQDAGTSLTYSALNLPVGATLNPQTGQFSWTPGPSQGGDFVVTLEVSDGQATTAQNILIRSSVQPQLPGVTLILTPSFPAIPGQKVTINAIASSVAPIASVIVLYNGQPLTLDANGRATVTAGSPGETLIQATATDQDGLVGTTSAYLKVRDPNDKAAPVVSFDPSTAYASFSKPGALLGTVSDSNLDSWTLQVATPDDPSFTLLASGRGTINDAAIAQVNPSQMTNGFYQLLLTATDISGRSSQARTQIEIHTATKPGDEVVTDADVSITLDGTPILIQRTYDPLTRSGSGDFGYGWTFTNRETNLQTNLPTTGQEDLGVFNPFQDGTASTWTCPRDSESAIRSRPRGSRSPARRSTTPPGRPIRASYTASSRSAQSSRSRPGNTTTSTRASPTTPAIPSSPGRAIRWSRPTGRSTRLTPRGTWSAKSRRAGLRFT